MAVYKERILFADENELFCEGLLKHLKCQHIFEITDGANSLSLYPEASYYHLSL